MMLIHLLPANDNIGGEGYLVLFGGGGTRDGQPQIRIDGFARLMAGIMSPIDFITSTRAPDVASAETADRPSTSTRPGREKNSI